MPRRRQAVADLWLALIIEINATWIVGLLCLTIGAFCWHMFTARQGV